MIVPYWLEDGDEEGENTYKQILADNIEHFHTGNTGRSVLLLDHDNLTVAGIVHLNNYQPIYKTGDLSALFFDKRAFTKRNLYIIYRWLFVELGLGRVNMVTQAHNRKAQILNEKLGAKLDAKLENFWGDETAYVYGLLRPAALEKMERWKPDDYDKP